MKITIELDTAQDPRQFPQGISEEDRKILRAIAGTQEPITINLNGTTFLTKEQVEDAIQSAKKSRKRRFNQAKLKEFLGELQEFSARLNVEKEEKE